LSVTIISKDSASWDGSVVEGLANVEELVVAKEGEVVANGADGAVRVDLDFEEEDADDDGAVLDDVAPPVEAVVAVLDDVAPPVEAVVAVCGFAVEEVEVRLL
jgi:hypothetical protein